MFDFSWGELMLIGAVALVVIGPKELPTVLRTAGQWMARIRRMAGEFQSQFQEALREAEMSDLKKQVDELNQTARDMSKPIDPTSFATESKPASSAGEPTAAPPSAPASETQTSETKASETQTSETQTSETQTSEPSSAPQAPPAGTTDVAQSSAHEPSAPEPGAHASVAGDRPE
jgi:sec-independent protein translocase protein TatB